MPPTTLDAIVKNPAVVSELPIEQVAMLALQLAAIQSALASRLLAEPPRNGQEHDQLLTVEETSKRLKKSVSWLHHHASEFPFLVRVWAVSFDSPRPVLSGGFAATWD
jgi:hypothetical protein